MNLMFMKLDMVLEMDPLEMLINESNVATKKLYEIWKHSKKCCMMMMESYVDESVHTSIIKMDSANRFIEKIRKKLIKFDMIRSINT